MTGQRPFRGDLGALLHQVVKLPHVPPSQAAAHLPPGVDAVVARALAKHPDARFASAKDFAEALRALRPSLDPHPTPEPKPRLSYRLLGTALALAGITALGAALAGWLPGAAPIAALPCAALRMPDFDAALIIIHIASTGEVTHLGASFGIPPHGQAGTLVTGGGSRTDLMLGVVGPPYGTDLIIAIASSVPLFGGGGRVPADANGIADSLAVTAETLGGPGGRASADILVLRTVRR